ncbi:hypothetical protein NNJEOMEG_03306 [Fundidesulfovibrio magnetotacticus]|uniref:Uncharacterized protein n=1 Tax=Fundidesulfovibrio magnetotacticus TaxID=2730080 RepID=A0A6V8LSI8_9BACT|nr:hypothetical protein [Fundidesulfovibrio magnetotacticus]GFK95443.1 hypothetical protein NNJEOMEG_03306 [Fundidesulfovibrio magnetotacticus]
MSKVLKALWAVLLAVWFLTGFLLAAGFVSASPSFPFALLVGQAALWCLPLALVWTAWLLLARVIRLVRAQGPDVARGAGKAAILAAKALGRLD